MNTYLKTLCLITCAVSLSACESMNTAWDGTKATLSNTFAPSEPAPTTSTSTATPVPATSRTVITNEPDAIEPVRSDKPLNEFVIENMPYADEATNHGTPPVSGLLPVNYRAPTPVTLAGGKLISTYDLLKRLNSKKPPLLINALVGDSTEMIADSVWLSGSGQKGKFTDPIQEQLGQRLQDLTDGKRKRMLVFYCTGFDCWRSYNAALRAVNLGYRNVYWYRGGLRAWYEAGLPTVQSSDDRW